MTGCDFSAGFAIVQPEVEKKKKKKGKSRESSVPVLNYLKKLPNCKLYL